MSDYSSLKATINANIKANNNHEITGAIMNSVLNAMVNSLGAGYQFIGVATPTNPGTAQTPDYKCFYLATTPGTYTNLGGLVVADGEVAILKYDTSWTKEVTGIATADQLNQLGQEVIYDVSLNNSGATFASLSALLSDADLSTLIPTSVRCGGMSIRFIQTSGNKYAQYRLMADSFSTTVSDWQGIDDRPTAGSHNLVKSGNINGYIFADGQPYIKELYINDAGVEAGVATIHNVYRSNNNFGITFSNATKDTFVAQTLTFTTKDDASGIIVIGKYTFPSIVYGYIIVDWDLVDSNIDPLTSLNDISYNIDYSPSIKSKLLGSIIDSQSIEIENINDAIFEKDKASKDMTSLVSWTDTTSYIWVQYPKENKISNVNCIKFKARRGTTDIYLVTINGASATWELIKSITNDVSEEDTIKVAYFDTIVLNQNQYIGLSGSVYYSSDNPQGFKSVNINTATGAVSAINDCAFAYIVENGDSIYGQLETVKEGINTNEIGHSVGNALNQYDTVVTLASDNTGDYTDFHSAAYAALSAVYRGEKTLLLIKPGIYTIDAAQKGGNGYQILYDIKGIGDVQLECLYDGSNTTLVQEFAPLYVSYTVNAHSTIRIENVTLIVSNVRYCVHDELGGLNMTSYTHIYKNCKFKHLTAPNNVWASPRCIGGGLGNKGLIIIDNCEFESVIDTSVDYHTGYNGGAQSSKVIITNCILANNTVSATSVSYENEPSVMIVKSCILNSEPIHNDPNNLKDMKLISMYNIII